MLSGFFFKGARRVPRRDSVVGRAEGVDHESPHQVVLGYSKNPSTAW